MTDFLPCPECGGDEDLRTICDEWGTTGFLIEVVEL